ncbi:conserved hypothetical protein [Methanocaldococcus infernus ME]|uniref:Uncharacterized protein n=1 Tax=Methanocaldococcus infernus (strain DSM 11812 / JCM 15783 / ME) TaxID=573063 RepID=D5VQJ3_METIM|nr:hypothetical protein [Methanocaldococcus infernus]ADG12846.1 conserved hypothetical protein [Methanocaldococcus infernus ME]
MRSKELVKKILLDIYKHLDEYSKDVIRGDLADIKFKGFYLEGKEGEKVYIKSLDDVDNLKDFDVMEREYILKSVNLKNLNMGLVLITLSSRKSSNYKFRGDNYKVVYPTPRENVTVDFKERILKWMEKSDDELDKEIIDFDSRINKILEDILKKTKFRKNISVHLDVFIDPKILENFVERDKKNITIWVHPVFMFSDDEVLRGLLAYELSRVNSRIIENEYKSIIKYCKEYKLLTNKTLKILEKVREIANKKKDEESLEEIEKIYNDEIFDLK